MDWLEEAAATTRHTGVLFRAVVSPPLGRIEIGNNNNLSRGPLLRGSRGKQISGEDRATTRRDGTGRTEIGKGSPPPRGGRRHQLAPSPSPHTWMPRIRIFPWATRVTLKARRWEKQLIALLFFM